MMIEKTWRAVLDEEIGKPYIRELKQFLGTRLRLGEEVYPPQEEVFRAFLFTPFEKVKVVIMGQDPYHGPGQAQGLSFSVKKEVPIPPSLKNIYRELKDDLGIPPPLQGSLISWARQGVLLLNATLTVARGQPRSHYGRGWEIFTDAVIEKLCEREDPLVFILWGRSAQEKCDRVFDQRQHPHAIIKSAHPSPFSCTEFFGSRPFSRANAFLREWNKTPIDWGIPP